MENHNSDLEQKGKRTISSKTIIKLLGGLVAILLLMMVALSPIFVLKTIDIKGNSVISDNEIMRISGVIMGENMFQLETDDIKQTLMKDVRIEQAIVKRSYPSRLEVQIIERRSLAMVQYEFGFLELSRGGMVLGAYKNIKNMSVPIITGVQVPDLFVGDTFEDEQVNMVLKYLEQLNDDTIKCISEINISDSNNVVVYVSKSVQIKMGKLSSLDGKTEITESVINEIKQAKHPIEYVDARFDKNYTVKLRK